MIVLFIVVVLVVLFIVLHACTQPGGCQ